MEPFAAGKGLPRILRGSPFLVKIFSIGRGFWTRLQAESR